MRYSEYKKQHGKGLFDAEGNPFDTKGWLEYVNWNQDCNRDILVSKYQEYIISVQQIPMNYRTTALKDILFYSGDKELILKAYKALGYDEANIEIAAFKSYLDYFNGKVSPDDIGALSFIGAKVGDDESDIKILSIYSSIRIKNQFVKECEEYIAASQISNNNDEYIFSTELDDLL